MPVFVDKILKIWKAKRRLEIYKEHKLESEYRWEIQKHPVGYSDIINMINRHRMRIISVWGDIKTRSRYSEGAGRATFWLQKPD
jgi:hypothetical protein